MTDDALSDLLALATTENTDTELVPDILPVDARLAVTGPVSVFAALFDRAASITPAKEIIAGTGYALLTAVDATTTSLAYVQVTATDGDMTSVMVAGGVDVLMAGSVLVPGKKFVEILKSTPTSAVRIEVLGNTATLRSGRAQWSVQTPVGDSLPPAADVSGVLTLPVPVASLLGALVSARKAASTSTARASLMQLDVSGGAITGLDGGRMHRQRVENLVSTEAFTIPLRVAEEVIRLLRATTEETVEIGGNSSHLIFRVGHDQIVAQRSLSPYPDVETQVVGPALTNTSTLTLVRSELIEAVKRVRINADPDYQALFLTLTPGAAASDGQAWTLVVSAADRINNTARESIDVGWKGPPKPRALCVNHRYLSDLLTTMDGEFVAFKVGEDSKTVRLPLFVEDTTNGFTGWIQQMRPGYMS